MSLGPTIEQHLERHDFDSLEEAWLTRLAEAPDDLPFFVATARALVERDAVDRARLLLELLDDELCGQALWGVRLELLRQAADLLLEPPRVHAEILRTLEELYGRSPSFGGLVEHVGLRRAPDDIPKTWTKVDRLLNLLAFDIGAVVWMEGKGAGRVAEVNLDLERLKIDFESHRGLAVGFSGAGRLLEPLAEGHFLRRKLEAPERLRELARQDPGTLLEALFESVGEALTAARVRDALAGIVGDEEWPSWWAEARKHPHLVAVGKGRQAYRWSATSADAQAEVRSEFETAEPRYQLALLRRHGARDPALGERMAQHLAATASRLRDEDPALAFEILSALERTYPETATTVPGGSAALLSETPSAGALLDGIAERSLREAAYERLRGLRSDWLDLFADRILTEPDPTLVGLLAGALREVDPERLDRALEQALAQPRKAPAALTWVARQAATDRDLLTRNPLRLLQHLLDAWGVEELRPYRRHLAPLLEAGGTAVRLLGVLRRDQAGQARDLIRRAAGLADSQRDLLSRALENQFPELREESTQVFYATPEAVAARQVELTRLLEEEIPANRRAIEEARALGDLRENFEYKSARQRHEYLSARAAALEEQLRRVRPLDPRKVDTSEVRVGCRVELSGPGGEKRTLTLLGPWESDPKRQVLSYESDLGGSLLGRKPGDTLELDGAAWTVRAIAPYA